MSKTQKLKDVTQKPEVKLNDLRFTDDEMNTILFGLQKLPWETSNALIQNIMRQVDPVPAPKTEKDAGEGS